MRVDEADYALLKLTRITGMGKGYRKSFTIDGVAYCNQQKMELLIDLHHGGH